MIKINIKNKYEKGYTLLFAVMVSSLVLAVGISILNISKKEFILSSAARESIYAFYSADSGLECALYADSKGYLSTSTTNYFTCTNIGISVDPSTFPSIGSGIYRFTFQIQNGTNGACSIVQVDKWYVLDPSLGELIPQTNIQSRGYNTGWNGSSCTKNGIRIVERALDYTF